MATRRATRQLFVACLLGFFSIPGCGGGQPQGNADRPSPALVIASPAAEGESTAAPARLNPSPAGPSFADAVTEVSPDDQQPPPDRTLTGLSTGKLREEVLRRWGQVRLTGPSGKPMAFTATLDTDFGPVVIELRPDIAPNHVRNFVALAEAHYYDGLHVERIIQQQSEGGDDAKLELVEAGCPLGTGEPGIGHLGYWLKPEFNDKVTHEPGTVGACRDAAPDSAACRFYITLSKAPVMDGNFTVFGKVTRGLEAVHTIAQQPRAEGSPSPEKPVVIRKVTIQTREVGQ
jgi:peptidyl-prolyl cis-trans isomerase B (cyclophilin B)